LNQITVSACRFLQDGLVLQNVFSSARRLAWRLRLCWHTVFLPI